MWDNEDIYLFYLSIIYVSCFELVKENKILELIVLNQPRPVPIKLIKNRFQQPLLNCNLQLNQHEIQIVHPQTFDLAIIKLIKNLL